MQPYLENLNLIDLISKRHAQLRRLVREDWAQKGEDPLTGTESHILALLEREPMTVAQISRIIDISRQGIHKCVQGLISRDYIKVEPIEGNSRDKLLLLTAKGIRFCTETLVIKEKYEKSIKESIGEERFNLLKDCLKDSWFNQ